MKRLPRATLKWGKNNLKNGSGREKRERWEGRMKV
jgi:hypothetical protein